MTASISSVSSNEPTPKPTETTAATTQATQATTQATQATTQATQATTQATQATTQATQATTQATQATQASAAQTAAPVADNGGNADPAPAAAGDATVATTTKATVSGADETIEETTNPTETAAVDDDTLTAGASQETVMSVVGEVKDGESYDETIILDETHDDGSPVVMGLKSTTQEELNAQKARKQMITTWAWVIFAVLLAGAGYARYRYLKSNKGYKGSEIAINFIPGASDLIYAVGYHFNIGKGKATAAAIETNDDHSSFNTASAMKELKKMEAADNQVQAKPSSPSTPSVPHKRPKELSVNHAAAVAAAKAEQDAPKAKVAPAAATAPVASKAASAPEKPVFKPASPVHSTTTGSALGTASAAQARERAEAAKEQLRMRAEARRNIIEEAKKEELQQRPPFKSPDSLSVNHAASTAAATTATAAAASAKKEEPQVKAAPAVSRPAATAAATAQKKPSVPSVPHKRPKELSVNRAAVVAAEKAAQEEPEEKREESNSPFKPLDRSAERAIYSTPGIRSHKTPEDYRKMSNNATQLGTAVHAQRPQAPYAGGRAPVWSQPGVAAVNPFKPSGAPAAETPRAAAPAKTEPAQEHASIADQPTHKSAFFDRAEKARTPAPERESKGSVMGDLSRPSGKGKAPHAPTKGMSLEGKDSSLLNNGARPTATEPLPGFKPVDWKQE
ncbi:MAG: hypothetical protein K6F45_02970 [Saccharofermentans sp.]|nr:hypothetical protein [Saccharofermentans sp.]